MTHRNLLKFGLMLTLLAGLASPVAAKVSQQEAARLKKDLTPFGAERAGNADGTIPAWDGGLKDTPAGVDYKPGCFLVDIFSKDKLQFSITAANVDKYADKLNPGQIALLKKYPDSYRIDVYPTRRTAAAPQWVYDNTMANATRATLTENRQGMKGAYGGIPFPIPQGAEEVVFNHLVRWKGPSGWGTAKSGLVLPSGAFSMAGGGFTYEKFPYYQEDGSLDSFSGDYWYLYQSMETPERRKGELLVVQDHTNPYEHPRKAWQYLPGQRRVRRAPTIAYDTPNANAAGMTTYDDAYGFNGALDRFDWKLVGKKEMFIPYNGYKTTLASEKNLLTADHPNPDDMRWELHRVWVVEGTLKDGKRHAYSKRTLYLDEDTWTVALTDKYDGKGNLWRTTEVNSCSFYFLPCVRDLERFNFDFQTDTYTVDSIFNDVKEFISYGDVDDSVFTPANLRREGRR